MTAPYFKEYFCKCGCGIVVKASDPKADEKIEAWKAKHKCKGGVKNNI